MAFDFDPLDQWLAIPPDEQPPNHYRLLGLELFESDRRAIAEAAERRKAIVRSHRTGPHERLARKLESRLAKATACLLNPYRKQLYDQHLRSSLASRGQRNALWPPDAESGIAPAPRSPRPAAQPTATGPVVTSNGIRRPPRQRPLNRWWKLAGTMAAVLVLLASATVVMVSRPRGDSPGTPSAKVSETPQRETTTTANLKELEASEPSDLPSPVEKTPGTAKESLRDVGSDESKNALPNMVSPVATDSAAAVAELPAEEPTASPASISLPPGANMLRFDGHGFVEVSEQKKWFDFTRPFTVELWARFSPDQEDHWLIGNLVYGSNHPELSSGVVAGWQLWVMKGQPGRRRVAVATGNGFWGEFPIRANSWRHIALCRDEDQFYLYVDGRRVAAQPVTQLLSTYRPSPLPMHVGGHALLHSTQPPGFRGELRGLRVSSNCRYNENFSPSRLQPDETTVLCWSFSGEDVSAIRDLAGGEQKHTGLLRGVRCSVDPSPLRIALPGMAVATKPASRQPGPIEKPADRSVPIPDNDALLAARQALHDTLGDDLKASEDRAERARLIDKLRTLASDSTTDAATRYVLFEEACRRAAASQSWTQLDEVLREWSECFPIDPHQVEADALVHAFAQLRELSDRRALARRTLALLPSLIHGRQWETISAMVKLVTDTATAARDADLGKSARYWRNRAAKARRRADDAERAKARLADHPNDDEARWTLGRYLCFDRRNWAEGLPYLAGGSDRQLAGAAQAELAGAPSAGAQMEVANRWLKVADSMDGTDRAAVLEHALEWARRAIPELTGLEKVKATQTAEAMEADLAQMAAALGQPSSAAPDPTAALSEPPPGFHGMLGRIQVDGRDAGVLWKYGNGLTLSHGNIINILQQAGISGTAIRVEFSGLFHLGERASLQIIHRGGSPQKGTASLAIDGRTVSELGGEKPTDAVFEMELESGLHRVTWTLAGSQLGSCAIQLVHQETKQPLTVFHTPAMLSALRETPFRARINVNMVQE